MKSSLICLCFLSSHVCGIKAFHALAFESNVIAYQSDTGHTINTTNLTDGDRTGTCERFSGTYIDFRINLQNISSIESSRLVFKGNHTTNGTNIFCYDFTPTWPFFEIDNYRKEIPHTVEFEAQRTGTNINFQVWEPSGNTIEIELCEIEINGCDVDHYGEHCLPCDKSENCEVCDVNDGACYVCREGYTGLNCSIKYKITGEEEIPASSSTVIKIPYPKQLYYSLYFSFNFTVDDFIKIKSSSLSLCEVEIYGCPRNHYGSPCRPCFSNCDKCNAIDGSCICQAGYTGENCTDVCSNNTYGANCVYGCGHCYNDTCHHVTGNCLLGCTDGWTSNKCNQACSPGYYGRDCSQNCSSHCITPYLCDRYNGSCIGGCATGWTNDTCDKVDTDYCVDWAPSDVSVSYHNMTWRKEKSNNIIRYDPAVTFLCNFSLKSDEDLLYDVLWYIDKQEVVNQTVEKSSNYTAVITAHDILKAEKKIGSDVHCKVGAKRIKENFPCLYKVGSPFFAGIKILNPNIELERKGSKNVQLEMTIPFASESLFINDVPQPILRMSDTRRIYKLSKSTSTTMDSV